MIVAVVLFLLTTSVLGKPQSQRGEEKQEHNLPRQDPEDRRFNQGPARGECRASDAALKAAAEAAAAQAAQNCAGAQAARMVKAQLAERALNAARAAKVGLEAKEALLNEIKTQVRDLREQLGMVASDHHHQRPLVDVAVRSVQCLIQQRKTINEAMQQLKLIEKGLRELVDLAEGGSEDKVKLHDCLRRKLAYLEGQQRCLEQEVASMRKAVHSACQSAKAALGNVRRKKFVKRNTKRKRRRRRARMN